MLTVCRKNKMAGCENVMRCTIFWKESWQLGGTLKEEKCFDGDHILCCQNMVSWLWLSVLYKSSYCGLWLNIHLNPNCGLLSHDLVWHINTVFVAIPVRQYYPFFPHIGTLSHSMGQSQNHTTRAFLMQLLLNHKPKNWSGKLQQC